MQNVKYKRVVLKISGEALAGETNFGLDTETLDGITDSINEVFKLNVEVAIVV